MKKIFIPFLLIFFLSNSKSVLAQTGSAESNATINSLMEKQSVLNSADPVIVSSFPNPASVTLTFTFKGNELNLTTIEIYKLTGEQTLSFKPEGLQYTLDVTSMEDGIYFYKIIYNGKVLKTEKFVVLKK
jgi:phage tail sheath gpL-like